MPMLSWNFDHEDAISPLPNRDVQDAEEFRKSPRHFGVLRMQRHRKTTASPFNERNKKLVWVDSRRQATDMDD